MDNLSVTDSQESNSDIPSQEEIYPQLDYKVPNAQDHQGLVVAMRKACGWDAGNVPRWFVQQSEGTRFMVIFYLPGTDTPVGMGGVELKDFDHQDKDVADIESKRGCVVSLFLYKKFRKMNYLGRMLKVCEDIGRENGLETLTIYGLSLAWKYEKFGFKTFKVEKRNYGGQNDWETRFLQKSLR